MPLDDTNQEGALPPPPAGFGPVQAVAPADQGALPPPPPGFAAPQALWTEKSPFQIPAIKTQEEFEEQIRPQLTALPGGSYYKTPDGKLYQTPKTAPGATDAATGLPISYEIEGAQEIKGPSTLGVVARGAFRGAPPAVTGLAGFTAAAPPGAALGTLVGGPAGGVIGGLITGTAGALGGGYLGAVAEQKLLSLLPQQTLEWLGQTPEQQAADINAHKYAEQIGQLLPNLFLFGPRAIAYAAQEGGSLVARVFSHPLAQRLVPAAITGAQEVAMELAHGERPDPASVALSAGAGALLPGITGLGRRVAAVGETPWRTATGERTLDILSGGRMRPPVTPPPEQPPEAPPVPEAAAAAPAGPLALPAPPPPPTLALPPPEIIQGPQMPWTSTGGGMMPPTGGGFVTGAPEAIARLSDIAAQEAAAARGAAPPPSVDQRLAASMATLNQQASAPLPPIPPVPAPRAPSVAPALPEAAVPAVPAPPRVEPLPEPVPPLVEAPAAPPVVETPTPSVPEAPGPRLAEGARDRLANEHEAEIRAEVSDYFARQDVQEWAANGGDLSALEAKAADMAAGRMLAWHEGFDAYLRGEEVRDSMSERGRSRMAGWEAAEAEMRPAEIPIEEQVAAFIRGEGPLPELPPARPAEPPAAVEPAAEALPAVPRGTEAAPASLPASPEIIAPGAAARPPSPPMLSQVNRLLYTGYFEDLSGRPNILSLQTHDPILERLRPFYDRGLIREPEDIQALINANFDPVAAGLEAKVVGAPEGSRVPVEGEEFITEARPGSDFQQITNRWRQYSDQELQAVRDEYRVRASDYTAQRIADLADAELARRAARQEPVAPERPPVAEPPLAVGDKVYYGTGPRPESFLRNPANIGTVDEVYANTAGGVRMARVGFGHGRAPLVYPIDQFTVVERASERGAPAAAEPANAPVVTAEKHTKTGRDLFAVRFPEKPGIEGMGAQARKLGGQWSSFRGGGMQPGWMFKTREAADRFAAWAREQLGPEPESAPAAARTDIGPAGNDLIPEYRDFLKSYAASGHVVHVSRVRGRLVVALDGKPPQSPFQAVTEAGYQRGAPAAPAEVPEHPGLVVQSLQTGRRDVIQPPGTRPPAQRPEQPPPQRPDVWGRYVDDYGSPKVDSGERLRTVSGRITDPAPNFTITDGKSAMRAFRRVDAWLVNEAKKEIEAPGNENVRPFIRQLDPRNLSPADRDMANEVLWGDDRPTDRNRISPEGAPPSSTRGMRTAQEIADDLDRARDETNTAPTQAQIESGNYAKGKASFHGIPFVMETPRDEMRRGVDADGRPWEVEMPVDYGYISRTEGADGDHVDAYIGPRVESQRAFVVDQVNADTGAFDEHKVMLGFNDWPEARQAYLDAFSDGRGADRLGNVTSMSLDELKGWLKEGDTRSPIGQGALPLAAEQAAPARTPEAATAPTRPETEAQARPYGEANTVFTKEMADEARERLRRRLSGEQLSAGFDPGIFSDGVILAGYHIEAGAHKFADFARAMVADVGETIRPYLSQIYEGVRRTPGFDASRMTPEAEVLALLREPERMPTSRPSEEPGHGVQGTLPTGDAGAGPEAIHGTAAPRPPRPAPAGEEPGGPRHAAGPAGGAEEPAAGGRAPSAGNRPGNVDNIPAGEPAPGQPGATGRPPRGTGERPQAGRVPDADVKGTNHVIEPGSLAEERSPRVKARDNLSAIDLAKRIADEARPATKEEQATLAKYVGWGGLANIFPDPNTGQFRPAFERDGQRLKELLSPEEYRTAARSTQYAHYTSEPVIRAMWDATRRLGFKGGTVFEPGMGIGHFLGMMPADIAAASKYQGLELDHLTSKIAKLLYPESGVRQADFTRTPMPEGAFDLAIGNPPFGDIVIKADPKYAPRGFMLHDYFFAKSLDSVRPGGLLAFVTSAGTMNKMDGAARRYMAERAEFVGGVRLPSTAFAKNAGTEVTTDILFFKKRPAPVDLGDTPPTWTETTFRKLPDASGAMIEGPVSRYFSEHPEMVLGEEGFFDKLYKGRYAVHETPGTSLDERLREAFAKLPENVIDPPMTPEQKAALDFSATEKKDGSYYIAPDGRLMQYSEGAGRPVLSRGAGVEGGKTAAEMQTIRQLLPIRDALRDVFRHDLAEMASASGAEPGYPVLQEQAKARKALNRVYDAFVKKNGPINKAEFSYRRPNIIQQESARAEAREDARELGQPWHEGTFDPTNMIAAKASTAAIARARQAARDSTKAAGREFDEGSFDPGDMPDIVIAKRPNIDPFQDDQESYRLRALEKYDDETGAAEKRRVFFENTLTREEEPQLKSAHDGILWSVNKLGRLDVDAIAEKLGTDRGKVIEDLGDAVMRVPGTEEVYVPRDAYLSGDVVSKLEEARAAAERDPRFQKNVSALEAAQPEPLSPAVIAMNLGMPWVPVERIHEFTDSIGIGRPGITYSPILGQWIVAEGSRGPRSAEWGTGDYSAHELLSEAMNRRTPVVRRHDKGPPSSSWVDAPATQAAQDKVQALKDAFSTWAQQDPERAHELALIYNDKYNRVVLRNWNGDYLTTPGVSSEWSWRPHQTRVIARIIQDGNTYMAHAVGAGKTSAMIGSGMEMRRLGLVNKPMYVVPNHMLGQFAKEFYEQYPTARIAVADDRQFHTSRRKQFVANVAQQDLDAVIITNSAFKKIPISEEFGNKLIQEAVDEIDEALLQLGQNPRETKRLSRGVDPANRYTVKRLQNRKEKLEQRLAGAMSGARKDVVNTFEEMGVDFLFVDEAHQFRKLSFVTQTPMKGIDPDGSDMAWDLYTKIRYLDENRPGRSVVMASGTPITNTMGELYSLSRFLQPQALKDRSLSHFDSWSQAFGDTRTDIEQTAQGSYEPVTRFSKFVNLPELFKMVGSNMDVVTSEQLAQYVTRPELEGGKRIANIAPQTDWMRAYQADLARRVEHIRHRRGRAEKGDDILLSVIMDGRKGAIDPRLVDPSLPNDPASKLNIMIDNVYRIWSETKNQPFYDPATGYKKEVMRGPATQMVFANLGVGGGEGKFSAYDWMRREWIRRGIPANEIAFIKDYGGTVAKQRVLNDMNDGKVRILVGSTSKMGTGINAQRRLIAIHNLDPLWFPADDEQRNGRGLRQGNLNPHLQIHDYSTKGTYDSTMWGMMARKGRFIEQFFRGDPNLREMEDLGEASQYEQAAAMSTSDERVIKLVEMRQELQKLERRETAHRNEQYTLEYRARDADRDARNYAQQAAAYTEIADRAQDVSGDHFRMTVGDKALTERKDAAAAIDEFTKAVLPDLQAEQRVQVGEIGGFQLTVEPTLKLEKVEGRFEYVKSDGAQFRLHFSPEVDTGLGASTGTGVISSASSYIRDLPHRVEMYHQREQEALERAESNRRALGKPFTEGEKIEPLRRQIAEYEAALRAPGPEEAPPEGPQGLAEEPAPFGAAEAPAPFFSALTRAVEAIPQPRAPGAHWANMIRNLSNKGVKQDEIAWSGIEDWLKDHPGAVTKDEVLAQLRVNEVRVEEVHKGSSGSLDDRERLARWIRAIPEEGDRADLDEVIPNVYRGDAFAIGQLEAYGVPDELISPFRDVRGGPTRYGEYALPGGERYRELLLTLPQKPRPEAQAQINELMREANAIGAEWAGNDRWMSPARAREEPQEFRRRLERNKAIEARQDEIGAQIRLLQQEREGAIYRTSHWEEPNVLAHIRFDDRTDAEGRKVLHVAEIQSDWAQGGRRRGFRGDVPRGTEVREHNGRFLAYGPDDAPIGVSGATREEALENARLAMQGGPDAGRYSQLPNMPLKTQWPELAMKRILRFASEHGDSPALSNLRQPQSVRELGENIFGGKMAAAMPLEHVDGGVLSALKHDQVRQAVIASLPVDVMNDLRRAQLAPEDIFRNPDMVVARLSPDHLRAVARGILSGARSLAASLRAKLTEAQGRGVDEELLPAMRASDLGAREIVGLLAPQSLYHEGLPRGSFDANVAGARTESRLGRATSMGQKDLPTSGAQLLNTKIATREGAVAGTGAAGSHEEGRATSVADVLNWHNKIVSERGVSSPANYAPGYDRVTWDTGETQAARYDLSKHVSALRYDPGRGRLEARLVGDTQAGNQRWRLIGEAVTKDSLPDQIGKEAADRLLRQPEVDGVHSLSGVDLKAGGEGMRGFYDKMLPAFLNRYAKRWGAKVERGRLFGPQESPEDMTPEQIMAVMREGGPDALEAGYPVHAIDITPQMRESVMRGQALWEGAGERGGGVFRDTLPDFERLVPWHVQDPQEAARRYVAYQGQTTGNEHLVAYDARTGAIVHAGTSDQPNFVAFPYWDREQGATLIVHHNHPSGSSLSPMDLDARVGQIVAHGGEDVFAARPSAEYEAAVNTPRGAPMLSGAAYVARGYVDQVLRPAVKAERVSAEDGNAVFQDLVNRALAHAGFIDYVSTRDPAAIIGDALTQRALKAAVDGIYRSFSHYRSLSHEPFVKDFADGFHDRSSRTLRPEGAMEELSRSAEDIATRRSRGAGRDQGRGILPEAGGLAEEPPRFAERGAGRPPGGGGREPPRAPPPAPPGGGRGPERGRRGNSIATAEERADLDSIQHRDDRTIIDRAREFIADIRVDAATRFKQAFLDDFAGLEAALKGAAGSTWNASKSVPLLMSRLTRNHDSVMATVVGVPGLRGGYAGGALGYDPKTGVFKTIDGTKPFVSIFKPVFDAGKQDLWALWAITNRAKRLMAEGREHNVPQALIDKYADLDRQHPEFRTVMAEWRDLNKRTLDLAEATGLINRESRALFEHDDYVPFYRALGEDQLTGPGRGGKGIANIRSGIRRLKGGEAKVDNIYENMVKNLSALIDRSMKNAAMRETVGTLSGTDALTPMSKIAREDLAGPEARARLAEMGLDPDAMTAQAKEAAKDLFGMLRKHDPELVSVMENGKPQYYRVNDPLLLRSLISMGPRAADGLIMTLMQGARRVLTHSVTIDPAFMAANLLRDSLHSAVVVSGFTPGLSTAKGFVAALNNSPSAMALMAGGVGGGHFYSSATPERALKALQSKGFKDSVIDTPAKAWHALQRIGAASENANRIAIYEQSKAAGMTELEALGRAQDMLNFTMRGDAKAMQFFIETVPFLNARVQGLYRMGRGAAENPAGFLLRGGLLAAAAIALWEANHDDPRYKKLEDWERQNYFHFFLGDGSEWWHHLRLPSPFEVGAIFGSIPTMLLDYDDNGRVKQLRNAFVSLVRNQLELNPVPQLLKPVVDLYANRDAFTGHPIINEAEQGMTPEMRYGPHTSSTMIELGQAIGVSPDQAEHLVRGYGGTVATYLLAAADSLAGAVGLTTPRADKRLDQIPLIARFVREEPALSSRWLSEFYDLKEQIDQLSGSLRKLKLEGDIEGVKRLVGDSENARLLGLRGAATDLGKRLSAIRRNMTQIEAARSIDPAEKRMRIDRLLAARNRLAEEARPIIQRAEGLTRMP